MIVPLSSRFPYAHELIEHVEERNCALGCRRGARNATERKEWGPGGSCDVLARASLGDIPVAELDEDEAGLTCTARDPLPERKPRPKKPKPAPPGQLTIGEP